MSAKKVVKYRIEYHPETKEIHIILYFDPNSFEEILASPDEALFIVDLLRNERDVFWDSTTKILYTNTEKSG